MQKRLKLAPFRSVPEAFCHHSLREEKKIGLQKCIALAQPRTGVPMWNSGGIALFGPIRFLLSVRIIFRQFKKPNILHVNIFACCPLRRDKVVLGYYIEFLIVVFHGFFSAPRIFECNARR